MVLGRRLAKTGLILYVKRYKGERETPRGGGGRRGGGGVVALPKLPPTASREADRKSGKARNTASRATPWAPKIPKQGIRLEKKVTPPKLWSQEKHRTRRASRKADWLSRVPQEKKGGRTETLAETGQGLRKKKDEQEK